jgi:hypothetical protein
MKCGTEPPYPQIKSILRARLWAKGVAEFFIMRNDERVMAQQWTSLIFIYILGPVESSQILRYVHS